MNKISLILSVVLFSVLVSCGGGQTPSKRVDVYAQESKDSIEISSDKIYVPFRRTPANLAEIQVSLNGEPFNMWWDTGASITCISALELQKLLKAGKIELDDYQGSVLSHIADGSSTESLIFNIKEIYIPAKDNQYLVLRDIDAAVSPNAEAPLLIGQNVIQNLPKHTFDEAESVIVFDK